MHRLGKVRLGCDVGEGVGRSQSVIVVRDDLGVLEIFANQFESKAETAHKICGLAQKWQIGDWMGPPTLRYQGNVDGPWYAHGQCEPVADWPMNSSRTWHGSSREPKTKPDHQTSGPVRSRGPFAGSDRVSS